MDFWSLSINFQLGRTGIDVFTTRRRLALTLAAYRRCAAGSSAIRQGTPLPQAGYAKKASGKNQQAAQINRELTLASLNAAIFCSPSGG